VVAADPLGAVVAIHTGVVPATGGNGFVLEESKWGNPTAPGTPLLTNALPITRES
jgi:hypothetical protein